MFEAIIEKIEVFAAAKTQYLFNFTRILDEFRLAGSLEHFNELLTEMEEKNSVARVGCRKGKESK